MEAVHQIAIYIRRFHNLDLFEQGWYQIKVTMRWEDGDGSSVGTPSRVVQYEALNLAPDDIDGVWRIDDTDHSFSSQTFRIKYARQDVFLSVMISFNLSLNKFEVPSTSAVILKFELMYAPVLGINSDFQASLDANPAAVHEFRIPPKSLLGLHSYCPVHFDIFHAVLVDTSVHISILKGGASTTSTSDSHPDENVTGVIHDKSKQIMIIKAFLTARAIIFEELQKLSKSLNQRLDLTDSTSRLDEAKMFGSFSVAGLGIANAQVTGDTQSQNLTECDFLDSLSKDELFSAFHLLGDQLLYLWSTYLKFHRLGNDRKAEWSIWMVHSKVEMPHHYMSSAVDDSSYHGFTWKTSVLPKLTNDPSQTAAMRAELHRRSIAQMTINNRSIQDMHIFGDPSRIPIIIIERLGITSVPKRAASINSYFRDMDRKDKTAALLNRISFNSINKLSSTSFRPSGRVLKIVIFVHGFQGHHLDLRLVRNQWLLIDPKVEFLMSEANEEKTSGDFRAMGSRLANEVISFVKRKMDKASRNGGLRSVKLSFVGHSIGNVIIRTALAETCMEPYLRHLYTYVSISGPHLGYLYSSNSIFNSGLWLLKKLKGTQCIHQLTLTDDPDLRNTFFYKLCKQRTLNNFKNVILLSSPQDGYVPYHSARIEMCQASSGDFSKKGKVFLEMLNECMDQIRAPFSEYRVIMRGDVNFDVSSQGRSLNTVIGRAAHIEFLESDIFARFIMWSFPELFR